MSRVRIVGIGFVAGGVLFLWQLLGGYAVSVVALGWALRFTGRDPGA